LEATFDFTDYLQEESTNQYFMTSLEIHLKKSFINRWFGTRHWAPCYLLENV